MSFFKNDLPHFLHFFINILFFKVDFKVETIGGKQIKTKTKISKTIIL